ncbi:hypothetical protein ACIQAC_13530 [Streptomyces sp. NPDC088387]|uniref:hypothetical protein n=1 Tax=Streptomyces sp. NPDC088387 TaxID=3365859 RepID=UPI00381A3F40
MRGGGEQTLASTPSDKQRAARFIEEDLLPDTRAAAGMANGGGAARPPLLVPTTPTSPLIKQDTGLKGLSVWASDQGVSDALAAWQGQANKLLGRLQQELNALRSAKNLFQSQDADIGAQAAAARPRSSFDEM